MKQVVESVKRRLYSSFALLERHLELVCRNAGCGGGGVFFRREHMKDALGGDPLMETPHSDFGDCEYDLVASPHFEDANKEFCSLVRSSQEGKRRCMGCDRQATRRVALRKRPYAYTCHAGLTDIMTPVVVQDRCVGVICVGMVLREGTPWTHFDAVWERIQDIEGVARERMEKAHARLTVLTDDAIESLKNEMGETAQTVAALWGNLVGLAEREHQLERAQLYEARDLTETLLYGGSRSQEDVLACARRLGLKGLPTALLVFQLDPTDRRVLSFSAEEHRTFSARLMELLRDVSVTLPDTLPASVAPGEAVLLLHLSETRNPNLRTLRLREIADRAATYLQTHLGAPVLMGIGPDYGAPARLRESYREARRALWLRRLPDHWRQREHDSDDKILGHLAEILENLHHGLSVLERGPAAHAFEQALRVIATVGDEASDIRRVLFVRLVEGFLDRWMETGAPKSTIEQLRLRYVYDFPSLQTIEDMALWVRSHFLCHLEGRSGLRDSPGDRLIRHACRLVEEELESPPSRAKTATTLGISESTLARLFHEELGMSYREFVLRARMAHAQRLLLRPEKSVSEVAQDVGYFYTSAFSRAFTRVCGVSPTEYRTSPCSYPTIEAKGQTRTRGRTPDERRYITL